MAGSPRTENGIRLSLTGRLIPGVRRIGQSSRLKIRLSLEKDQRVLRAARDDLVAPVTQGRIRIVEGAQAQIDELA